jgi:hypothetical protein
MFRKVTLLIRRDAVPAPAWGLSQLVASMFGRLAQLERSGKSCAINSEIDPRVSAGVSLFS